jgi:hypothetical protein
MHNMIRSTWLRFILLFALVLSASNCGDESEVIIEELDCMLEGFEGGTYIFAVNSVSDSPAGCSFGQADTFVGQLFGPVVLPGTDELPSPPTDIPGIPLVGTVEVIFSIDANAIRVRGTEPVQAFFPGIGNITATVSGTLCPVSATRVEGQITVRITSPISCNVTALATGSLQ